jgi:hypothetical protein
VSGLAAFGPVASCVFGSAVFAGRPVVAEVPVLAEQDQSCGHQALLGVAVHTTELYPWLPPGAQLVVPCVVASGLPAASCSFDLRSVLIASALGGELGTSGLGAHVHADHGHHLLVHS